MKELKYTGKLNPAGEVVLTMEQDAPLADLFDSLALSSSRLKNVKVFVNNAPIVNYGLELKKGDAVRLDYTKEVPFEDYNFEPADIVYEDDLCLVANKPENLLVHSDGNGTDNLTARINGYLLSNGAKYPAQPIHRIDFEAQGLVLFSKNPLLQAYFDRQMEDKKTVKEYIAVIEGNLAKKHIDINNPIGRNRHIANAMIVTRTGKPSHTHLQQLKNKNGRSLVKATISTGRKHQIRVHLSSNGHPIVGDRLYGKQGEHLMLQSHHLKFKEPLNQEIVDVTADLPDSFVPFSDTDLGKTK